MLTLRSLQPNGHHVPPISHAPASTSSSGVPGAGGPGRAEVRLAQTLSERGPGEVGLDAGRGWERYPTGRANRPRAAPTLAPVACQRWLRGPHALTGGVDAGELSARSISGAGVVGGDEACLFAPASPALCISKRSWREPNDSQVYSQASFSKRKRSGRGCRRLQVAVNGGRQLGWASSRRPAPSGCRSGIARAHLQDARVVVHALNAPA